MPVSPDTGSRFAAPVGELMAQHELKLLEGAAFALRGDQSKDDWATTALAQIRTWRMRADRGVAGAVAELGRAVRTALLGAQAEGAAQALIDLPGHTVPPINLRGLDLDVKRLTSKLAAALQHSPNILEGVLREAVRAGVDEVRAGKATRRSASQQVLDKLVSQGITGFRDSKGRKWGLTSYTEMAVRTETQARALAAGNASLLAAGLDLVIVSDSPRECPLCRPFEGKVLSLTTETGVVTKPNELVDGQVVSIKITATLEQARAAGFQHPNCTHSYSGYIPGVTKQGTAKPNPEGYKEKQKQRGMERKVRQLKRAAAVAHSSEAQAEANSKLRQAQKQLREYVKAHDLKRQPGRESVTKAV